MIGKLKGTIDYIHQSTLFINVNDISYRVSVPVKTLLKLNKTGTTVELFIHTYVREDMLSLYGFQTAEELFLFETLISVSGVGARLGLAVLSSGTVDEVTNAVINADVDFFQSISGIGKKSAQRIIVELKTVLGDKKDIDLTDKHLPSFKETMEALRHFGFSVEEAREAIKNVKNSKELSSEELIKETLRMLGN